MIAFRLLVLTAVWLLGTATFSLAQEGGTSTAEQPAQPAETASAAAAELPLVVPDVRGLPYVFAKGVLEDAGFAWKVKGKVEGYAVDLVSEQSVKPGTRVVDTGAPTIVLYLEKNPDYEERGLPEDTSPYRGTKLVLVSGAEPTAAEPPTTDTTETTETTETAADTSGGETATDSSPETEPAETTSTEPVDTTPSTEPEATTGAEGETTPSTTPAEPASSGAKTRPRAFLVPGAPREPLDEIPLPARAKRLKAWVAQQIRLTYAALSHWQYQHGWVVAGARFGWWQGARALRILIGVDEEMQRRFSVGYESERIARSALAEVLVKSKR